MTFIPQSAAAGGLVMKTACQMRSVSPPVHVPLVLLLQLWVSQLSDRRPAQALVVCIAAASHRPANDIQ